MTIRDLASQCGWTLLADGGAEEREAGGCYIGDLLSWVMGRAQAGDVWLTVMGNVNAVAVASLADVSCIVLTENASLDAEAKVRAESQGVTIYSCEEKTYETAVRLCGLLK